MSDVTHGPGWWQASDGKWYPPEQHPGSLPPPPPQAPPQGFGTHQGPPGAPATPTTNGFAVASLVLGLLWLYWVGSVLALVFGYKAKAEIDRSEGRQSGRGMAVAGIVLGWIGVVLPILAIVLITMAGESAETNFRDVGEQINRILVRA